MRRLLTPLLIVLAGPAFAQDWQPLGLADPFPPTGTRVCAEGGGDRICLALYCNGAGAGLRLGYVNTTVPADVPGLEVGIAVDNPLAENVVGSLEPTSRMRRVERYPYFVATGEIAPAQSGPLLAALKRGNTVTINAAGDGWNLPLRGSSREITRAEVLCGPPARPESVPVTAPPEAPAAAAPPAPLPAAPDVGSAAWEPVPPSPEENVYGTRLCTPASPGGHATRCLNLLCFVEGTPFIPFLMDTAIPQGRFKPETAFPVRATNADGQTSEVSMHVAHDAGHLIAVGYFTESSWAAFAAAAAGASPLHLDMPDGAVSVRATGFTDEISRLTESCTLPGPFMPGAAAAVAPGVALSGRMDVELSPVDPRESGSEAAEAVRATQGAAIADYENAMGEPVQNAAAQLIDIGGNREMLFTQLCGRGGWFGSKGCTGDLFIRDGGDWSHVFFDSFPQANTITLDFDAATQGWPVIHQTSGATWAWRDGGYTPR